jgi:ATP-binding cassette, subfamily B, bacterial
LYTPVATRTVARLPFTREFGLENEYQYNRSSPIRWIVSHLARYPLLPLALVVTALINNTLYSYVQIFIGRAFDLILTPGWQNTALLWLALGAFGAAAGQNVLALLRNFTAEFLAQAVERDTRDELYVSLLGKSQTFHARQRVGDIMSRATNDVRSLNLMFSPGLMLIIDSFSAMIAPYVLIALLRYGTAADADPVSIGFAITLRYYVNQLKPVSIALRRQFGGMNAGLAETIAGIEVIKANAQERVERGKFTHNASLYRDYYIQQGKIQAFYLPMLVFSVAWAGAFLHGALLWRAGTITPGELVMFMGLMSVFRFPTFISIFSFDLVQLGLASSGRILEIINKETELDENLSGVSQPIVGEVRFENVSFGYDPEKPILQNISFTAQPGETVAIVGQTGSGKTSLTRLINRIFDADNGRVLIDGIDARDWNLESLRSQISTIEQDIFLFSRSIAENIAFGAADASQAAIEQAAREAQAHDFIMSFADGYETEVGERGVTLSGGQRQRLAIARAFLTNPRILILDDSASAIDSATEDRIQQAMRRISQERTTFLITHRLSQIRWADQILVLQGGKLVDQGKHEDLLERSDDYRRIFARYD